MNCQVLLEIPYSIFPTLHKSPEEFSLYIKILAAVKMYEIKELSMEKAAELANLSRSEFIYSLGKFNVDVFQYSEKELEKERAILGF